MNERTKDRTGQGGSSIDSETPWSELERLRAIEETAPVGLVARDLDGRVMIWNATAERMFGWTASEILGHQYPLIPDDHRSEYNALRERVLRGEVISGIETWRQRKDGSKVAINLSIAPLHDTDGRLCGTMSVLVDITEHKRLQQQFLQAQKMDAVGQLAGGIAHDFNNLLTVIRGYADMLLEQMGDKPIARDLHEIRAAAERAASLTHQLLTFGRRQTIQPRVLDLNVIVTQLDSMLRRIIGEHITFVTELSTEPCLVNADEGQLGQVLMNLVVNAKDAMPDGGTLTIATANMAASHAVVGGHSTTDSGPCAVLTVTDSGCGMDAQTLAHIFEPFFTTKEIGKGSGLGLSTVYGIVQQSHGQLSVSSEPKRGTRFTISLPRASRPTADEPARTATNGRLQVGRDVILLVEDDEAVREYASTLLARHGHHVLVAATPDEALTAADGFSGVIDLVLTDVILPGMDGTTLVKLLRATRPETRVLYMSGYAPDAIRQHGISASDSTFLEKPFTAAQLTEKVHLLLQTRRDFTATLR